MAWNATSVQTGAAVGQAAFSLLLLVAVGIEAAILVRHKRALDATATAQKRAVDLQEESNLRTSKLIEAQLENLRANQPQIVIIQPTYNSDDHSITLELAITHAADVLHSLELRLTAWSGVQGENGWEIKYDFWGAPFFVPNSSGRLLNAGSALRLEFKASDMPGIERFYEQFQDALGEWEEQRSSDDINFAIHVFARTQRGAEQHASLDGT